MSRSTRRSSLTSLALYALLALLAGSVMLACGKPRITEIGMDQRKLSYVSGTAREGSTRVEVQWRQTRFTSGIQLHDPPPWSTLGSAPVHGESWSLPAPWTIDLIDGIPDPAICCLRTELRARAFDAQGNASELPEVADETKYGQPIGVFGPVVLGHYAGTASVTTLFSPMPGILDLEHIHMLIADGPETGGDEVDMQSAGIDVAAVRGTFPWIARASTYGTLHVLPVSTPSGGVNLAIYPGAKAVRVKAPFRPLGTPDHPLGNPEYPFVLGMVTLWAPGYAAVSSAIDARTDLADIQIDVTESTQSGTRGRRGVGFSGFLRSSGTDLR